MARDEEVKRGQKGEGRRQRGEGIEDDILIVHVGGGSADHVGPACTNRNSKF